MITKFTLKSFLVLCISILLSTVMVGSAVTAQEVVHDNPILAAPPEQTIQGGSPVPGGPGFISVSSFAFKPFSSDDSQIYDVTWMYNGGADMASFIAPVYLPHDATITKVVFFFYDGITGADLILSLLRVNMFDGSVTPVARGYSSTSSGLGFIEAPISIPLVDNQLYSYILDVDIPGGHYGSLSLINVRIDYSYPSYLPCVQK